MSGNSFGTLFRITTFGESHGPALGVVIDGVPAGLPIELDFIQNEMARRRPGQSQLTTGRNELDKVEILSGVFEGKSTGTPLTMLIANCDQHSGDYRELADKFRCGHADFGYQMKYGCRDYRGGGRSSGRETAGRVAAGAVAKLLLRRENIRIVAGALEIGGIAGSRIDFDEPERNPVRAFDAERAPEMAARIAELRRAGDSVGGIVGVFATGLPAGLGEPVFDKLDALLAQAMLSIGAVKGIEFGNGFAAAKLTGSANNDEFLPGGRLATNRCGGVLGGLSTGSDLEFRLAVKPTPTVLRPQRTIDTALEGVELTATGRHDPCIVPRLVPVAEAMTAVVLADLCLRQRSAR